MLRGQTMKTSIAVVLAVFLGGCGTSDSSAQLSDLQRRVSALSGQVQALKERSTASEALDLQRKCSMDAERAFKALGYDASKPVNGITAAFFSHYNPALQRCFMV